MDPRNRSLAELVVAALAGNLMTEQLALLLDACGNEVSGFHGPHGTIQQRLGFRRGRLGSIGNPGSCRRRILGSMLRSGGGSFPPDTPFPCRILALILRPTIWPHLRADGGGSDVSWLLQCFAYCRRKSPECGLLGGRHGRTGGQAPSLRLQRPQPGHCRNGHENQGKQDGQFIPHGANLQDMPDFPKIRVVTGRPIDLR